jgi:hypothetical protein
MAIFQYDYYGHIFEKIDFDKVGRGYWSEDSLISIDRSTLTL